MAKTSPVEVCPVLGNIWPSNAGLLTSAYLLLGISEAGTERQRDLMHFRAIESPRKKLKKKKGEQGHSSSCAARDRIRNDSPFHEQKFGLVLLTISMLALEASDSLLGFGARFSSLRWHFAGQRRGNAAECRWFAAKSRVWVSCGAASGSEQIFSKPNITQRKI
ncbi:hypothetical protein B0H19DRAFT_1084865 [Mycena capillaripes]|nr:hypothetical protein B0H19DRAFT_1084865 [Mycena capillaripes]